MGVNPVTGNRVISGEHCKHVLAVLAASGLYELSGDRLYDVGLPGKSDLREPRRNWARPECLSDSVSSHSHRPNLSPALFPPAPRGVSRRRLGDAG